MHTKDFHMHGRFRFSVETVGYFVFFFFSHAVNQISSAHHCQIITLEEIPLFPLFEKKNASVQRK